MVLNALQSIGSKSNSPIVIGKTQSLQTDTWLLRNLAKPT